MAKSGHKREFYFPFLDGLRGFAFLLVFVSHVSIEFDFFFRGVGKIGVWMFFILSAFLLTYTIIAQKNDNIKNWKFWGNFTIRRVLRIYPLYVVVMLTYLAFDRFTEEMVIDHLLLQIGVLHFWAIPVEVLMYLLIPLFGIVYFLLRRNLLITTILTLIFIIGHQAIYPSTQIEENSVNFLEYISLFLLGSYLAYFYFFTKETRISKNLARVLYLAPFGLLALLVLSFRKVLELLGLELDPTYTTDFSLLYGLGTAILIYILLKTDKHPVKTIFQNKFLRLMGAISYPAYLFHYIVIHEWRENNIGQDPYLQSIVMFVLTILISVAIHYTVEKQILKVRLNY